MGGEHTIVTRRRAPTRRRHGGEHDHDDAAGADATTTPRGERTRHAWCELPEAELLPDGGVKGWERPKADAQRRKLAGALDKAKGVAGAGARRAMLRKARDMYCCFYMPAQWVMACLQWAVGERMCHLLPRKAEAMLKRMLAEAERAYPAALENYKVRQRMRGRTDGRTESSRRRSRHSPRNGTRAKQPSLVRKSHRSSGRQQGQPFPPSFPAAPSLVRSSHRPPASLP